MNRNERYILFSGIIIAASLYAYQFMDQPISLGDVSAEEAARLIGTLNNLIILDVRTREEYDIEHIQNAVLIPVQELENRVDELFKDETLLVYCRTGNRSQTAVTILEEKGFTKIYHMNGGITIWKSAGYPTV